MSHTIKLNDQVFNQLEEFQDKRETFSQAVERLLKIATMLYSVIEILGPAHHLTENKNK